MKTSRIALLAGIGFLALTLPASAASTAMGDDGARTASRADVQLAQVNTTRQANEERASDYRSSKKMKKKMKRSRKMRRM